VKKYSLAFSFLILSFLLFFFSCTRINEATELGGDLIPPVDNVNTFEANLETQTNNALFHDTSRLLLSDAVALGAMNDPEFGKTEADLYFSLSSSAYGTYPFIINKANANNPDSLKIDSVVLTLAYAGYYGDSNSFNTVRVFEIAQNANFSDTTLYQFNHSPDFITSGSELGSATFQIKNLDDSIPFIRRRDTSKTVNLLHINLDPQLGRRFAGYDTTAGLPTSGFRSDSIFKTLFRGLAIKSSPATGQGGLAYFNLSNANSKVTVYFRATKNGITDTSSTNFFHITNGQANLIKRTPAGPYLTHVTNGSGPDQELYIQSTPGSYGSIKIPALDTFSNKVVHRAELIASVVTSTLSPVFAPPNRLILDRLNRGRDTAFLLDRDLVASIDGSLGFAAFGGGLQPDNTYRFNITRYVQGVITRKEPNDSLRIYAPLRTILYAPSLGTKISVPNASRVADGRVVIGGGNYPDPNIRLRLRIIYSNL
jgi:hypothetical protein